MSVKFPHKAPVGLHYEQRPFNKKFVSIWIVYDREFDYNLGKRVECIWGFLNTKTMQFHSPVNSKTVGNVVDAKNTTPYSAMQIKQTPLEQCFS